MRKIINQIKKKQFLLDIVVKQNVIKTEDEYIVCYFNVGIDNLSKLNNSIVDVYLRINYTKPNIELPLHIYFSCTEDILPIFVKEEGIGLDISFKIPKDFIQNKKVQGCLLEFIDTYNNKIEVPLKLNLEEGLL